MTKYIVSGYIGFDNFGDEAIAGVLVEKLKAKGAEEITLISSNPSKTAELYGVKSCDMLKFLPSLIKADVLVSGGGSLLQDVTSIKSLLYYLFVIYWAILLGKKVYIFAQGIGPINSKIGQLLTRFGLKFADKISVRDIKSHELLSSWGIKSELVKDPIFEMNITPKNQKGVIGVQLRQFNGVNDEFLSKLAEQIKIGFSEKEIVLLSLQDSADLAVLSRFKKILEENGLSSRILSGMGVREVVEEISKLEYLAAMRFHANVIGIKAGVKTLAINYDPKVEKLALEYNLPYININQEDFSEEFDKLKGVQ